MHSATQLYSASAPYECCNSTRPCFNPSTRIHLGVPFNRISGDNDASYNAPCGSAPDESASGNPQTFEATVARLLQNQKDLVGEIQALRSQVGTAKDAPESVEDLNAPTATFDLFNLVREFVDLKKREVESHERRGDFASRRRGPSSMPCRPRHETPSPCAHPPHAAMGMTATPPHAMPPCHPPHAMPPCHPPHAMPPSHMGMMPPHHPPMMPPHHPHMMGQFNPPMMPPHHPHMMGQFNPHMMGQFNPHMMGQFNPHMMGQFNPHTMGHFNPPMMGHFNPHMMGQFNPPMMGAPYYASMSPMMSCYPPVPMACYNGPCAYPPCVCSRGFPCDPTSARTPPCRGPLESSAAPAVPVVVAPVVPPSSLVAPMVPPSGLVAPMVEPVVRAMRTEEEEPRMVVCVEKVVLVDVPQPCECKEECCKEECCGGEKCDCCKRKEGEVPEAAAEEKQDEAAAQNGENKTGEEKHGEEMKSGECEATS